MGLNILHNLEVYILLIHCHTPIMAYHTLLVKHTDFDQASAYSSNSASRTPIDPFGIHSDLYNE